MATRFSVGRERSAFRRPHVPAGTIRFVDTIYREEGSTLAISFQ